MPNRLTSSTVPEYSFQTGPITLGMDEETVVILAILAILAVVGIVAGLTNAVEGILITAGLSGSAAGQFGSLLFFLILLGLIVLVWRGIAGSSY